MSSWADIESGSQLPASFVHRRAVMDTPAPVPRVRRSDRLVIGAIDVASHVFQHRARQVLLGSALLMLPMVALHLLLTVLAFDHYERFDGLLGDRGYIGVETGLVMLGLAIQSLTAHIIGAYTAAYLVPYQMGAEPTIAACLRRVLRKLPLLLLTWSLTHWPPLLVLWGLANGASAETLGALWILAPLMAMVGAATLLVAPVVMTEQRGVRSIGRAWKLTRVRFGAAFSFVIACAVLGSMLSAFIAFLPPLAESTGFITFGSLGWMVQGVTTQMAVLIVVPFVAIATSQMYLHLRVHAEGLDIVIAADRAFGASS